jgi:hypothetical protein
MDNYALLRLESLGFDPKRDFGLLDTYSGEVGGLKPKPRMWADEEGNLCIGIVDLENRFITSAPEKSFSKQSRDILYIKRLAKPDPEGGKYRPGHTGQGVYPCFWPFTLKAYKNKTKIKTLVLTEGYIKSYVLDKSGVLCIGLPGITVWKGKNQLEAFQAIQFIISACKVENIVWLTDGDTTTVEWKENKDLSKRPWSFFTSVRLFKEHTRDTGCDQFWMHIREDCLHKGIDDLLQAFPDKHPEITKELVKPSARDGHYFKRFNVGVLSYQKIKEYFAIHNGHEAFYKKYEDVIGDRQFVYGKGLYEYDEETGKLKYIRAGESAQYIMVDSTYYIKGPLPTVNGGFENVLKPVKPAAINKKFQDKTKLERFKIYQDIPHYDGFINRPSHINFQKEFISKDAEGFSLKYYNKYHQLSWNASPGTCELSLDFVKHIFGTGTVEFEGQVYNEYDLGLDYIQLLYLDPTQKLPILCLVSEERQTAKSTFWEWINEIFQQNVCEVSSDQLTGTFTSFFATCLLVYLEEAFIDRNSSLERIKSLVTASKGKLEAKFTDSDRVDNFLKIGLSSNNVRNFANISTLEIRFWVRQILAIPKDKYDPDFVKKLYAEIPAFLHYLQNRQLVTTRKSRSWFATELIMTEALRSVQLESRSSIEIMLDMVIREYITDCSEPIVRLSPKDFKHLLKEEKISLAQIRWGLSKFGITISTHSNHYHYFLSEVVSEGTENIVTKQLRKSSTYKIYADQFLTPEECVEVFDRDKLLILEKESIKADRETWFQRLKDRTILVKEKPEEYIEIINKAESYSAYIEVINTIPF